MKFNKRIKRVGDYIKLLDLFLQEYFAIIQYLMSKVNTENEKIIISSKTFYMFLDRNLYIKRNEKLAIYKKLNLIICNSNGYTSVLYDKETRKTKRMIMIDLGTYEILKRLYEISIKD